MSEKAEKTREKILATAIKHFLRDGFSGASLRSIVKDAGLTTGAFYKYYPTKEMLFDALVDPYVNHIYEIYDGIIDDFEKLSAHDQTNNMSNAANDGTGQMIDYIYDHYNHFRLLFKCGDSGKYEAFIHNMVNKEMKATKKYMQIMKESGMDLSNIDESLMQMIYTGFFSSILQIVEHDMDKEIAKKNVHQLKEFNMGGWERIWNIKFPTKP